jgi:hypothetical protein
MSSPIVYQHPITGETYADKTKFVESLGQSLVEVLADEDVTARKKKLLVDAADALAGQSEKKRGVVHLSGETFDVVLERRVNVSYPEKDSLKNLFNQYPELQDYFRTRYEESGLGLEKWLATFPDTPAAQAVRQIRVAKAGTPGIDVKPLERPKAV